MNKSFEWDKYSDQPKILDKRAKKILRNNNKKIPLVTIFKFFVLFIQFLFDKKITKNIGDEYFYGICVNLDKGKEQIQLVNELGIKSLQIRVFLSDIQNIDKYVNFAKSFGNDKQILITIIQSPEHINNHDILKKDIAIIFKAFEGITNEFMIGNAVNRIKWGFIDIDAYLNFYQTVQKVRDDEFSQIKLIGSSIIDFEYHFTTWTLFNNKNIFFDKVASLLYVDRRGSPRNKQYKIFDLNNKINFLAIIVKNSQQTNNQIYITETNYPLQKTAPYTPTSEKECISENDYSRYMLEYFKISKASGKVKKVFWHQLVAPGYGLVDNRYGTIRKTPAFYKLQQVIYDNNNPTF